MVCVSIWNEWMVLYILCYDIEDYLFIKCYVNDYYTNYYCTCKCFYSAFRKFKISILLIHFNNVETIKYI